MPLQNSLVFCQGYPILDFFWGGGSPERPAKCAQEGYYLRFLRMHLQEVQRAVAWSAPAHSSALVGPSIPCPAQAQGSSFYWDKKKPILGGKQRRVCDGGSGNIFGDLCVKEWE